MRIDKHTSTVINLTIEETNVLEKSLKILKEINNIIINNDSDCFYVKNDCDKKILCDIQEEVDYIMEMIS